MAVSFSSRTATAASSAAARRTSAPSTIKTSAANVSVSCTEDEQKQKMRKKRGPTGLSQLVDKPSLRGQRFFYAGGARGGKARLESDQMPRKALPCKACVERSDYFRAARRHKNNDIISGCRKSQRLFRQPEGGAGYPRRPLCRCCEKPVKRIFCRELR